MDPIRKDNAWDWSIDPPPPLGPDREPTPDPADVAGVDATGTTGRSTGGDTGGSRWRTGTAGDEPSGSSRRPADDRRRWLLIGAVVALLVCCCGAGAVALIGLAWHGYRQLPDHPGRSGRPVGLDQPVRDGALEFRVRGVQCGTDTIGDRLLNRTATGQFCQVRLTVRNVADGPVTFVDTLAHGYAPDGRRFDPDRGAGLLANADKPVFPDRLAPNQDVAWAIVYDVPRDTRIVRLRLRHTADSPGVEIQTG